MKKIKMLSAVLIILTLLVSCKDTKKEEVSISKKSYSVEAKTTTINWIAYKTTDKVPVKGQFTKVNFPKNKKGNTSIDALNDLQFEIPVSSLFTKDTIRDGKLKKYFFGSLKNTSTILGIIKMNNETSGSVELTMNGISQVLPITYVISDQMVTIEAILDLDNWKAQLALKALNEVCKDLHSGSDGIPKTWSEVKIEVATYLKYE